MHGGMLEQIDFLVFYARHNRSMNTLSIQRPRPSMLILMPRPSNFPVHSAEVNWQPWSVLKISGTRPVVHQTWSGRVIVRCRSR